MTNDPDFRPGTLRDALADQQRRGELMVAACPSRSVLGHLTSRWGTLVMVVLLGGTHRFSQLRRAVGGVSEKMLAQTLEALAADGLVLRHAYAEIPPRVEYSLTPMGREAAERLAALVDWIEVSMPRIAAARAGMAKEEAA